MAFHERRPIDELARYVDRIWTLSQSQDGDHESVILPDGCVEIVFAVEGAFSLTGQPEPGAARSSVTVLGLATKPLGAVYRGRSHLVGVRLTPSGAMHIVGPELSQLVNRAADAADLFPTLSSRLSVAIEELLETGSPDRLHCELRASVQSARRVDARIDHAASLLHARLRAACIDTTAEEVGLSTRQLDRCFNSWFGMPPKFIDRVARFRQAFALGMARQTDWAAVAAHCGYADQSHLCREFLEFSHQTPEQMRLALASEPDV
jgi:AraC-like DNA-binding protein